MKQLYILPYCFFTCFTFAYEYDVVVIGCGAAGIIAAQTARSYNKKVAIVDKKTTKKARIWESDIPIKALIKAAQVAEYITKAHMFGIEAHDTLSPPKKLFDYIERTVDNIAALHSAQTLTEDGITLMSGSVTFEDAHTIIVNNQRVGADKFIIATGGCPFVPDIHGINQVPYMTVDTFFQRKQLPRSIIIAGQGPIGTELASALHKLGIHVTLLVKHGLILPSHDFELIEKQYRIMKRQGIQLKCNMRIKHLSYENGMITAQCLNHLGQTVSFQAEAFLVALGNTGNVSHLGLEQLDLQLHRDGIVVDDTMKTNVENIYACGDVVGQAYTLSRVAYYQAKVAAQNAVRPFWKAPLKVNYSNVSNLVSALIPLGAIGLTEQEARKLYGKRLHIYQFDYGTLACAHIDNATEGMAKFICDTDGNLLGAHVLGAAAEEVIDNVHIGQQLAKQFENYLLELRTSPNYLDIAWEASKKSKLDMHAQQGVLTLLKNAIYNIIRFFYT